MFAKLQELLVTVCKRAVVGCHIDHEVVPLVHERSVIYEISVFVGKVVFATFIGDSLCDVFLQFVVILIERCSKEEAAALIPFIESILNVMRSKDTIIIE